MISDVVSKFEEMSGAVRAFNAAWPRYVVDGAVWRLPLLQEKQKLTEISPELLCGSEAITEAIAAIEGFTRLSGQAPGTVLRLPGWFALSRSFLPELLHIKALKEELAAIIEATRIELGLAARARTNVLRLATTDSISTNQVLRTVQAFEGTPRLVIFTWAGHTGGTQRFPVQLIMEQLQEKAERQAARLEIDIQDTIAAGEIRAIANLPRDVTLIQYRTVSPHPRVMLYFSESTRYDAMPHANLPVFFLAGDTEVRGLPDFDASNRSKERPDSKGRHIAVPSMKLYVDLNEVQGLKSKAAAGNKADREQELEVESTYGVT